MSSARALVAAEDCCVQLAFRNLSPISHAESPTAGHEYKNRDRSAGDFATSRKPRSRLHGIIGAQVTRAGEFGYSQAPWGVAPGQSV